MFHATSSNFLEAPLLVEKIVKKIVGKTVEKSSYLGGENLSYFA